MASSAQELISTLQTMQNQYQAHASNTTSLRDTVDAQVKNLVTDGQSWAVTEMRHLEETWQQHYAMLNQVIEHFHVTPSEITIVIEALDGLSAAL